MQFHQSSDEARVVETCMYGKPSDATCARRALAGLWLTFAMVRP